MRKYDEEFKREAIRKVFDGQPVAGVARELGVAEGLIHNWKKRKPDSSTDADKENVLLKKKLREVEMERDILKKRPYLWQGRAVRYGFIMRERGKLSRPPVVPGDEGQLFGVLPLRRGQELFEKRREDRDPSEGERSILVSLPSIRQPQDLG